MQNNNMSSGRARQAKLTADGQDWLVAALDPYHDYQYNIEGLPDMRTAPSVVQIHNQQYTITSPDGADYNAMVAYTGFNSRLNAPQFAGGMVAHTTTAVHPYSEAALLTGKPFGAFIAAASSLNTFSFGGGSVPAYETWRSFGSCNFPDRCRVVAVAFEIHNTTADIYRQGSLTVAQLPDVAADQGTITYASTVTNTFRTPLQVDRGCMFASDATSLQAVPGSQTWKAAEGVYAIPRMTSVPVNIESFENGNTKFQARVPVVFDTSGIIASPEPESMIVTAPTSTPKVHPFSVSGFSPIQVAFVGLSAQTSLTVTMRTIVEYFPAVDSALLPLATPSPCYDIRALQLYSRIIQEAPYAVPVGQNAAGDYFRKIMRIISEGLLLTSPLFGEFAPLVAGAGTVGKIMFRENEAKVVRKDEAGPRARQEPARKRK